MWVWARGTSRGNRNIQPCIVRIKTTPVLPDFPTYHYHHTDILYLLNTEQRALARIRWEAMAERMWLNRVHDQTNAEGTWHDKSHCTRCRGSVRASTNRQHVSEYSKESCSRQPKTISRRSVDALLIKIRTRCDWRAYVCWLNKPLVWPWGLMAIGMNPMFCFKMSPQ